MIAVEIILDGSLRVTYGDYYTAELYNRSSQLFLTKAHTYKIMVSTNKKWLIQKYNNWSKKNYKEFFMGEKGNTDTSYFWQVFHTFKWTTRKSCMVVLHCSCYLQSLPWKYDRCGCPNFKIGVGFTTSGQWAILLLKSIANFFQFTAIIWS